MSISSSSVNVTDIGECAIVEIAVPRDDPLHARRAARRPDRDRVADVDRARHDLACVAAELVARAAARAAPGTGTAWPSRLRSTSTVSRYSSSAVPSNHGVRSLRVMTLSPCSALIGMGCSRVRQDLVELVADVVEDAAVEVDQIHLVHRQRR